MILLLLAAALAEVGVVFVGDTGTGKAGQRQVADAIAAHCAHNRCDALLLLGDNFYPAGVAGTDDPQFERKFEAMYGDLGVPVYPVLGNHDRDGRARAQLRYRSAAWQMPGRYYHQRLDDVSLIGIDTTRFGPWQRRWLRRQLTDASRLSVVFGHHPAYATGRHGSTPLVLSRVVPELVAGQADLYLSGHAHSLQALDASDGVGYFVAGSGSKLRPVEPGEHTVFCAEELGFGYLHQTDSETTVQLIGTDGQPRHRATLD